MGQAPGIGRVRYFRAGEWVADPASLIGASIPARRRRFQFPRWARDCYWQYACHGQVFHAPNYFLPPYAENGVVTVHDLSVFKFPGTHPAERVKQFEKLFQQTLNIAAQLITDTEATRLEVMEYFGWPSEKITTVHLGVSSIFAPRSADELIPALNRFSLRPDGYVLCVSTIEPRKRIDALLDAYERLPVSLRASYPLVLLGDKGWRSEALHPRIDRGRCRLAAVSGLCTRG